MFQQVQNKVQASPAKGNKPFFQPKLSINEQGDPDSYRGEQEADAVAEKVINTPGPDQSFFPAATTPLVQRACAACEEEEKIQRKISPANIQKEDEPGSQPATEQEDKFKLRPPLQSIDWSGINSTMFNRGVLFPGSFGDSAQQEWGRQYQLYSTLGAGNLAGGVLGRFGLKAPGGDWNAWLANTTTPLAVDSALSRDYPTFNEQEERRGGLPAPTTLSLPIYSFKLEDGSPDTPAEREADSVAEKVISNKPHAIASNPVIQKKCAACESDEVQKKEDGSPATASPQTENYISSLSSQGSPLNETEKNFYGSRMGYDFSDVKIHTDASANESAKSLHALAYTTGNNIVFGSDKYQPTTNEGRRLMAHELTHVVQQSDGIRQKRIQRLNYETHPSFNSTGKGIVQLKPANGNSNYSPINTAHTGISNTIFLDTDTKSDYDQVKELLDKREWDKAFIALNKGWLVLFDILEKTDVAVINDIITGADIKVVTGAIGKAPAERVMAALYTVAVTKTKPSSSDFLTVILAKDAISNVAFAQRAQIVDYLKKNKSKTTVAQKLYDEVSKPLWGYKAAGLDFSDRFLKHSDKLGLNIIGSQKDVSEFNPDPYTENQPDTVTDPVELLFAKADVLFFSGHQYAQYKKPGVFTNETSDACFNIGGFKKPLTNVKLIVSTGCATICKDTAAVFKKKFPNAMVLGYRLSAPSDGSIIANAFARELVKKGPIDLTDDTSKDKVRDTWKAITNTGGSVSGEPGVLYNGTVEFWDGKKWTSVSDSDKANECHYH